MTDFFAHPSFDEHEQVIFVSDTEADMVGIIAIHNTALGPAAGGCRMQPYKSVDAALNDVLRLSQGMTMKSAVADLPLGGGKCVIIADPKSPNKYARLKAMAKHVQRLGGQFWTAIDVGVSSEDADVMAEECDYIFARASQYPDGFRPSHFTALGGFHAIRAIAHYLHGTDDLNGFHVAIQGVGATGSNLTRHLVEHGAVVTIADVNQSAVAQIADQFNVSVVDPDVIHTVEADVFAPCALGAVINDTTIPELKARAICGLANNQLERPDHGKKLLERNILYAPDFVVNAGGMMGASTVIFTQPNRERAMEKIEGIYTTVLDILERSSAESKPSAKIAEEMAALKIRTGRSQNIL
ncbi:MAG: Leu/Phe/Val dehydrogenase [Candidatus Kariarchaeaceae archaeon]|jgi:leucine dehydrogenase